MPEKPPIIGITVDTMTNGDRQSYRLGQTYCRAIELAGGLPLLIPGNFPLQHLQELRQRLDGLLLSGGADLDPSRFKGQPHPRIYGIDPERDQLEISLVQMAASSGLPFLGICRGIQVINIALGGTLYTDLADQFGNSLKHDYFPDYPRDLLVHSLTVSKHAVLAKILQVEELKVNSLHHQGIERLASSLNATAWAADGLIEAVELPGHPFGVGVQWHPEELLALPGMRALFSALIDAASRRGARFPRTME